MDKKVSAVSPINTGNFYRVWKIHLLPFNPKGAVSLHVNVTENTVYRFECEAQS